MKKNGRTLIAAAAMTGLLGGATIHLAQAQVTNASSNSIAGKAAMGAMTPKVHGCSGENECKGVGGCKTDEHTCKFKNSCKGKGGCHLTEDDIKDWQKQHPDAKPADKPATPAPKSA